MAVDVAWTLDLACVLDVAVDLAETMGSELMGTGWGTVGQGSICGAAAGSIGGAAARKRGTGLGSKGLGMGMACCHCSGT